tara:strand:+ start:6501 stop:6941 length:441 start_codon:yes stop_codon:yes gene_type:complete
MLKSKLKKELLNIENIILSEITGHKLPVYDEGLKYRKYENRFNKDLERVYYYTGLTPQYIKKYILGGKYSLSMIHYVLIKCVIENKLRTLYCHDVKKVVFHKGKYSTYVYDPSKQKYMNMCTSSSYSKYLKHYHAIKSYLKINKND